MFAEIEYAKLATGELPATGTFWRDSRSRRSEKLHDWKRDTNNR